MATSPAAQATNVLQMSAANLRKAHKKALGDAAKAAKKEFVASAKRAAPKRRVKGQLLGASYKVQATADGGTALLRATGPWHLVERGTKPHTIRPRTKRALSTPSGPYARVHHPGTKGKRPWAAAMGKIPDVQKIMAEVYIQAVGDAWS